MSYQTASDRVEALRNIRGGRLTKWKGIVASCAPTMGAVALAISTLGVAGAANAANECGVEAVGADTINCAAGAYATGITYTGSDGLTLNLNDAGITVGSSVRVTSSAVGAGDVTITGTNVGVITTNVNVGYAIVADVINASGAATVSMAGGAIVTSGSASQGLYALARGIDGQASIVFSDGSINTSGINSHGGIAWTNSAASSHVSEALMTGGSIVTTGNGALGFYALTSGTGAPTATMTGGTISTAGDIAYGLTSISRNLTSTATVTALLNDGDIKTSGATSYGVYALTAGLGNALAQMDGGTVTTGGADAYGLYSNITNATSTATATALLTAGDVVTTGTSANGIFARSSGLGATLAQMDGGTVTTDSAGGNGLSSYITNTASTATAKALLTAGDVKIAGANANGILAVTSSLGATLAQMDGGTVTTSGAAAYGLYSNIINAASAGIATALLTGGDVVTAGNASFAVFAQTNGTGATLAQVDGGTVTTRGTSGHGLLSNITSITSMATATALLKDGDIETYGDNSFGLYAQNFGFGATLAQMDDGSVTTDGVGSYGLLSTIRNVDNREMSIALLKSGDVATNKDDGRGVIARTSGLGATLAQMDDGSITTKGARAYGLTSSIANANNESTATALLKDGDIVTSGQEAYGLYAVSQGLGATLAQMDGGTVTTGGLSAYGLYSYIDNATSTATASAVVTGGEIVTGVDGTATSAIGVFALNNGLGDAYIEVGGDASVTSNGSNGAAAVRAQTASGDAIIVMNSGDIIAKGTDSDGLWALAGGDGGASVTIKGGTIDVSGGWSMGAQARSTLGSATVLLDGGSITTRGVPLVGFSDSASGVVAYVTNGLSSNNATVRVTDGSVMALGNNSAGIDIVNLGAGDAVLDMRGGTVVASGIGTDGVRVYSRGGTFDVSITDGSVVSGFGQAAAIKTTAAAGGTIVIGSNAVVDGSASGVAIRDGDRITDVDLNGNADNDNDGNGFTDSDPTSYAAYSPADGIDETGGNIVVTTAGIVTGDAILGLGDDTFNLTGGLYTGSVYGDDRDYALSNDGLVNHEGNDTFNWTGGKLVGGFHGQDGSDVVSIASGADVSGLTLLDGGDDLTAGDGFIDVLSVDGLSGAVDGSIITNWEEINVANSDVQVTDLVAGAVTVTASTVVATNLTADKVSLTNSTTTIGGTSVVATVNTCGGSTTLTGSTATTDVKGCASADTIVISGDAVIANAIEGAGGADTISVLGNASVASVNGAGAGSDGSAAADAGNIILVNTTGTVGTVLGGDQADAITLTAGTVGPVLAGGGADVIAAGGAAIASIDAGAGNDTATWSAGAVGSVAMGNGSDALVVSAATYNGSQVLDGGDDLSSADGMVDTLTLKNLTVAATGAKILNMENVVIDGGRVSFSDNALTTGSDAGTGLSLVNGGALDAGDAFALTGNLTVNAGSTFDGTGAGAGVYSISGNLANNGLVTTKDGVVGDTITVAGNYSGTGVLSVDINTATDTLDRLVIAGNVTGGPTTVVVNNLSPLGATGNALTVIAVGGTSAAGDFVLDGGSLRAGAFDYKLAHQGSNFVLASAVNSTGAVYQAVPMVMNGFFNNLPTLEQRVGQRQWAGTNVARGELQPSTGGWLRLRGDGLKASTTTGIATKSNSWGLQAGIDYDVEAGGDGLWVLGVTGQYGKLNSSVTNALGSGSIDAEGFGLGATATWYGTKGTYVDLQAQANWISSDMSSSAAGTLASGELSKAYALSAEVGHRFELNQNTTLVPQAQLTLGKLHGASFTDSAGNAVDLGNNNSTVGRLGLAYEYENNDRTDGNRAKAYVIGNILHDFSTDSTVKVAGADLSTSASGATWGEIGLGGSVTVDANKTVYGEASYRGAFNGGSNSGLGLTAGLRVQW